MNMSANAWNSSLVADLFGDALGVSETATPTLDQSGRALPIIMTYTEAHVKTLRVLCIDGLRAEMPPTIASKTVLTPRAFRKYRGAHSAECRYQPLLEELRAVARKWDELSLTLGVASDGTMNTQEHEEGGSMTDELSSRAGELINRGTRLWNMLHRISFAMAMCVCSHNEVAAVEPIGEVVSARLHEPPGSYVSRGKKRVIVLPARGTTPPTRVTQIVDGCQTNLAIDPNYEALVVADVLRVVDGAVDRQPVLLVVHASGGFKNTTPAHAAEEEQFAREGHASCATIQGDDLAWRVTVPRAFVPVKIDTSNRLLRSTRRVVVDSRKEEMPCDLINCLSGDALSRVLALFIEMETSSSSEVRSLRRVCTILAEHPLLVAFIPRLVIETNDLRKASHLRPDAGLVFPHALGDPPGRFARVSCARATVVCVAVQIPEEVRLGRDALNESFGADGRKINLTLLAASAIEGGDDVVVAELGRVEAFRGERPVIRLSAESGLPNHGIATRWESFKISRCGNAAMRFHFNISSRDWRSRVRQQQELQASKSAPERPPIRRKRRLHELSLARHAAAAEAVANGRALWSNALAQGAFRIRADLEGCAHANSYTRATSEYFTVGAKTIPSRAINLRTQQAKGATGPPRLGHASSLR